jgi:hypothetical protein
MNAIGYADSDAMFLASHFLYAIKGVFIFLVSLFTCGYHQLVQSVNETDRIPVEMISVAVNTTFVIKETFGQWTSIVGASLETQSVQ